MKMYPLPGGNCSGGSAAAPQAEDDETSSAGTVCHPDEDGVIGDPSSMSSAGGSVLYASLTVGQQYRATVSGTIDYTNYSKDAFGAPNRLADPECTTNKEDAIDGSKWLPHRWLATFGDDRVDVVSDAGDGTTKTFYDWTPLTPFPVGSLDGDIACSTDRKYTTTFTAVSNSMRFYLWDGVYDDNSGSFEIQVDLA